MPSDRSEAIATTTSASKLDRPAGAIVEPEPWHAPEWPADDERASLESRLQAESDHQDRLKPGLHPGERRLSLESRLQAESDHQDRLKPGLQRATSQLRRHREVLAFAVVVLSLAFALVEVPGGRIAVRGLTQYPLPPSCVSRTLLGVRCPGCGLTRSFIHLAEGDWRGSWRCHRLGWLLAAVLIFQIPYRLVALLRPENPPIPPRRQSALGIVLIALLIVNWLADVVTGRLSPL